MTCLLATGFAATVQADEINNTRKKILILGDSISAAYNIRTQQGWVQLLANKIAQEKNGYQVINASITGETSSGGLFRLPKLLNQHQPSLVVIELGGNDGLRGLSIKQLRHNLEQMIAQSKASQARVLLIGMKIPPNYGKRYTEAFFKTYRQVAKTENVILLPFLLEEIGTKRELMQEDGIHPNEKAQPLIMQRVWRILQKEFAL